MSNQYRFTGLSAQYARYRPGYPPAAVDFIVKAAALAAGDAVADVGAGTGIFTQLLLQRGYFVYAVEPNADMREELVARLGDQADVRVVAAVAEDTGLAAGSVKLVCAAQAFHWFLVPAFAVECRRILEPGAPVAILWNTRDNESPLVQEYNEVRRRYEAEARPAPRKRGELDEGKRALFAEGSLQVRVFPNPLLYAEEDFIGASLSSSYAPRAGSAGYGAYVRQLTRFFERHNQDGLLHLPQFTEVFVGQVEHGAPYEG